jgi:hypothetical protein
MVKVGKSMQCFDERFVHLYPLMCHVIEILNIMDVDLISVFFFALRGGVASVSFFLLLLGFFVR